MMWELGEGESIAAFLRDKKMHLNGMLVFGLKTSLPSFP